tara:strand:+ start:21616 stop:22188 length:573 start_codon:yes stop_codon:yes gene_type:complete
MYGSEMQPKVVFGEGDILDKFFEASRIVAPEACSLRSILINLWNPMAKFHQWTMPDNGVIHKRVWTSKSYKVQEPLLGSSFTFVTNVNEGAEKGVSLAADVTHSIDAYVVREIQRRCNFDRVKLQEVLSLILALRNPVITDRTNVVSLVEIENINLDTIEKYSDNELGQLVEIIKQCLNYGSFEVVTIHK